MCLGVVGKIIEINGEGNTAVALVDFWGVRRDIALLALDEAVKPGDHILNHAGFAIKVIPEANVDEALAFYEELLGDDLLDRELLDENDLMVGEIRAEIQP